MFAMTLSGRMTVELNPPERQLADVRRVLDRLDGHKRFSVVVFPLPDGARLDDVDPSSPSGYVQCAGSAERMTVELRESDESGFSHWVIGRTSALRAGSPEQVIRWGEFETMVHPEEVFTSASAADVFAAYLQTRRTPGNLHRRLLPL